MEDESVDVEEPTTLPEEAANLNLAVEQQGSERFSTSPQDLPDTPSTWASTHVGFDSLLPFEDDGKNMLPTTLDNGEVYYGFAPPDVQQPVGAFNQQDLFFATMHQ